MPKPNLTIDPEFRRILPPLTDEEMRLLQDAIQKDGCEIPIIFWENAPNGENPIIDGMNRFYICQRLKVQYPTTGKTFSDRPTVIRWIRTRQLGRRNLTDASRTVIRGQLYRELKGDVGRPPKDGKLMHDAPISTVAELAASERVDRSTLQRSEKAADAVEAVQEKSPDVAAAIMSEAIPMNAASALADATKAELKQVAAAVKTGDKKAIKEAVREATAPESSHSGDGAPFDEPEDDGPIAEFMAAVNAEKIKASKAQQAAFAKFDEDLQADLLASILAGRQTLSNAISTGEVAPLTIEEKIKAEQSKIDAFCRELKKVFDGGIDDALDGPWAMDLNRKQGAIDKFKALLETIRSCKPSKPCPRCSGDGCKECKKTGMVTTNAYQQLV